MKMEINSALVNRIEEYLQSQIDQQSDRSAQALLEQIEDWELQQINLQIDKLLRSQTTQLTAEPAQSPAQPPAQPIDSPPTYPEVQIDLYYAESMPIAS